MQTKYVLSYGNDLYFPDYQLAIENDENGHSNINKKTKSYRPIAWL